MERFLKMSKNLKKERRKFRQNLPEKHQTVSEKCRMNCFFLLHTLHSIERLFSHHETKKKTENYNLCLLKIQFFFSIFLASLSAAQNVRQPKFLAMLTLTTYHYLNISQDQWING